MDIVKAHYLRKLEPVFQEAYPEIESMKYTIIRGEEFVTVAIKFQTEHGAPWRDEFHVNVTADSKSAMLMDIIRACNRHIG